MYERMAVIADSDLMFPLRALGILVFAPGSVDEAREILLDVEKKEVALCLLHQSWLEPLKKELDRLEKKFCPVVAGFSDYRQVTDYLGKMMREMAIRATGSDSLVKKV